MTGDRPGPIDLAMCIDESMVGPALVALHSISVHIDSGRQVRVHVLTTGGADVEVRMRTALDSPAFRIDVRHVENPYAAFRKNDYISPATYLRFLLPDLLDVDKVLYLDADIIATRDLGPLFDTDLRSRAIGAVPDFAMNVGSLYQAGFKLFYDGRDFNFADYAATVVGLRRSIETTYFNAGVMLIDLRVWRETEFVDRVIRFLTRHPDLNFMDQDGLNNVCAGDYLRLDQRWNSVVAATATMPRRWQDRLSARARRWADICETWLLDPWIIHFAGPTKPWTANGPRTPVDDVWWSYAGSSPAATMFGAPDRRDAKAGRAPW